MDTSIVYAFMVALGILMAVIPFGVFMGIGPAIGATVNDSRLLITFFLLATVLAYLTSLGAFAMIQKSNCGQVKDMKQSSANAMIALVIQACTLLLVWLLPFLRGLVTNLLPPDLDPAILTSIGYAYWTFWASMFSTAIGGSMSGVCPQN